MGQGAHGDKAGSPEAGKRKAVAGERGQGSLRRRSSRPGTVSLAVVWVECVIYPAHPRAEVFRDIHAPGSAGKPIPGVTGYGSAVESGARRRRVLTGLRWILLALMGSLLGLVMLANPAGGPFQIYRAIGGLIMLVCLARVWVRIRDSRGGNAR